LTQGKVTLRGIAPRDARDLNTELMRNRAWLRQWEATFPDAVVNLDAKVSIRNLRSYARTGQGLPFVIEVDGELAGQLNVSGITYGSMSSASIGYWIAERFAGQGITPLAVAMAIDYCFQGLRLHRMEICIRPENAASLRVVEKLKLRHEGQRLRYIHINGDWRDHECFAVTSEEVPGGLVARLLEQ
jgi:ribosomal-protein-alanine N-acetyltransferase